MPNLVYIVILVYREIDTNYILLIINTEYIGYI